MISFRHHVVTLVAVFLALAVGVVLGAGPLSDVGLGAADELKQERRHSQTLEQEVRTQEAALAYAGGLTRTLGSATLDGRLEGRSVAVVRLPGSEDTTVEQLTTAVTDAGAAVTGTITVRPTMLAPSEKALVDTLSSQLATQAQDAGVPADASTYERAGGLLARAVASTGDSAQQVDTAGTTIMQGLRGAELVAGEVRDQRAPLLLVVLGDEVSTQQQPILTGLLTGFATQAHGVVVTGSTASATGGALHHVRAQQAAVGSTVDGVDTATGQISTVLALAAAYEGNTGDYGASGSDGAPPLG